MSLVAVFRQGGGVLSHGIPLEFQAMGVVDETVQDGVRQSWVLEPFMPGRYRRLAGQQGRFVPEAVIEDVDDLSGLIRRHGITEPIVDDEQVPFGELCGKLRI